MSGSVIERLATRIVGEMIHHDDVPTTWERADDLAHERVDRRRAYAIIDGELCECARWTSHCTGCTEYFEGRQYAGGGCEECGFTGKRRQAHWVPYLRRPTRPAGDGDAARREG